MAMTIPHSLNTSPGPENFYLVNFENRKLLPQQLCLQMLRWQISKPFIPRKPAEIAALSEKDVAHMEHLHKFLTVDPLKGVLVRLTNRELLNFSETCKLSYQAVRANIIWEIKLKKLLPSVQYLKPSLLNVEQQFQVISRKIFIEKRPYVTQLKRSQKQLKDGLANGWQQDQLMDLVGNKYDQTPESIAEDSQIGRCLFACQAIPKTFDSQQVFEREIRISEEAYRFEPKNL